MGKERTCLQHPSLWLFLKADYRASGQLFVKPTSTRGQSARQLNLVIDAEILFRQPGPAQTTMTDWSKLSSLIAGMNREWTAQRVALEPSHRRLTARRRKSPHRRIFWNHEMEDDVSRECQYCGGVFLPDEERRVGFVSAPASVEHAHRRAHCGPLCDNTSLTGLRPVRINRTEIFERDSWRCYLCNQPTPYDLRGFAYVPNAPSIDHVIPKGSGTDEADNLKCCCRRCNLEKGTLTLWEKLSIHIQPPELNAFSDVLAAILPRHPTMEEMVKLWRLNLFCDGNRVETVDKHALAKLFVQLSDSPG